MDRTRDHDRYSQEPAPERTPRSIKIVIGVLGALATAATIIAFDPGILDMSDRTRPLDRYTPCTYTIHGGDTITDLCKSEGFTGRGLKGCIDQLCRDNRNNRMPDGTTPLFDPLSGNCDSMRTGGSITFVDKDRDGKVNGQECRNEY
ncbi:MAG: hypothetical protein KKD17_00725 [Nanoarchaeota archaeon]|nr:hypothetical protein [Nanoarchaeota archaeon]